MGLKIITEQTPVTVYANERQTQNGTFKTYSIGVSSKDKDGNWINGFLDCQFKKGVEVAHKSKIEISNSFYTVNEYNGKKYLKLVIMDFNVVDSPSAAPVDMDSFMNIPDGIDEQLPFV